MSSLGKHTMYSICALLTMLKMLSDSEIIHNLNRSYNNEYGRYYRRLSSSRYVHKQLQSFHAAPTHSNEDPA